MNELIQQLKIDVQERFDKTKGHMQALEEEKNTDMQEILKLQGEHRLLESLEKKLKEQDPVSDVKEESPQQ